MCRTSTAEKVILIFDVKNNEFKNITGFDKAIYDFIPKLEYVDTKLCLEDVSRYGKNTPITNMLSGVLDVILEQSEKYRNFKDKFEELFGADDSEIRTELNSLGNKVKIYLTKQFPDCSEIKFNVSEPDFQDLIKNLTTSVDDGVETGAFEKGDGMQRALMLAIIQTYADYRREHEALNKSFIFLIDEGELHLHPSAQRNLKKALVELSNKGDQVFLNTHSSVLISDEEQGQNIFKVEKNDKRTEITQIENEEKPYIIYDLLGGSPADLLLPKNFFIVEGKSDYEFISRVLKRHYTDKPSVQIIIACGDLSQAERSLNSVEQIFKPIGKSIYKDKVVLLCDKQNDTAKWQSLLNAYPNLNERAFQLTVSNLEEYYPSSWKKTSDEVGRMSSHQKKNLAKEVGDAIEKNVFENEMEIVFKALTKCWEKAFN
ncbi:MAG: ATP-binding protein [Elusimicrobia bacterium]|nr:ATP-binding protein [Elusimicrobiota bacterium]